MSNKNYQSGVRFEYRVKKYFEKLGYYLVRSAGSKTKVDLVAIPQNVKSELNIQSYVLLIQCKHGKKISKQERDGLLKLAQDTPNSVLPIVAWSKHNGKIKLFKWKQNMEIKSMTYVWTEIEYGVDMIL